MVIDEKISGGDVMTVFFCVMIGSFSISAAAPAIGNIGTARGAAAILFDIIDAVSSMKLFWGGCLSGVSSFFTHICVHCKHSFLVGLLGGGLLELLVFSYTFIL